MFRPAGFFVAKYGVSSSAMRGWSDNNAIRTLRHPGGKRIYNVADVATLFAKNQGIGSGEGSAVPVGVIYARVSSAKQRGDLDRQIAELQQAFPGHTVLRDVGSGVNFKRPNLRALLERVDKGLVQEVVVMHRDRLARFGCDLLEWLLERKGCKLVVHRSSEATPDDTQDLADDLLAITTVFVASHHGKRGAEGKRRRREHAGDEEAQTSKKPRKEDIRSTQSAQGQGVPEGGREDDTTAVVRGHEEGL